jgi:hypothetical protein
MAGYAQTGSSSSWAYQNVTVTVKEKGLQFADGIFRNSTRVTNDIAYHWCLYVQIRWKLDIELYRYLTHYEASNKQEMKHNEGLRVSKFLNLKLLPFTEWDRDESDESWVEWLNPWNYCVTESILILCENSVSVAEQMYTVPVYGPRSARIFSKSRVTKSLQNEHLLI